MPANEGLQNWGRLLLPGVRKWFFDSYKEKKEQFSQVFRVETSTKALETDARLGGFSLFNEKGSMDATEYEDPTDAMTVQYRHKTFSKGFAISKEMYDDEQYGQIKKFPKELGRAARATVEVFAATVLNNSFTPTTPGPTGTLEPLIGMSHKRLDKKTEYTQNQLDNNPPLSESAIEDMLKLAAEQTNERGLKIQVVPDLLVVTRKNEFVAEKISKSAQLPGTDWNDINPMRGRFNVVVLDYIDPSLEDAWWMIDSSLNPLQFFWREKLNFKQDTEFDTDVAKYKARFRASCGWSDWRGILGSKGDASSTS